MRFVIAFSLCLLLALIQTKLWWGEESSYTYAQALKQQLTTLHEKNEQIRRANKVLRAELKDLREGSEMLENYARHEMGMIRSDEVLIQLR